MERVHIFIDGLDFYNVLKAFRLPTELDFHKLATALANGRELVGTNFYSAELAADVYPKQHEAQQKLFSNLRNTNKLTLRLGLR